mgnify:CR=1 FL=1
MSLTATYVNDRGRVHLAATSLGVSATYAVFDRTTNAITYTTVRGATDTPVASQAAVMDDHEFPAGELITYRVRSYNASNVLQATFTTTITVDLTDVWVKVVAAPYLNRIVTVTEVGEVTRPARGGVFEIVDRRDPIGVSALRSSRRFSIQVMTVASSETVNFGLLLLSGQTIYLQVPDAFPVPSLYAQIGDTTETEGARGDPTKFFTLPLTEVAAPDASVVGTNYSIVNVLADYATISAMIGANATIYDLMQHVGDPEDILVG